MYRARLHDIEGDDMTFSSPFTRSHGLDVPDPSASLAAWQDLGVTSLHDPAVVSALADEPLQVFFVDPAGPVKTVIRPADRSAGAVLDTRPGDVDGGPSVVRSHDGRIELFVAARERIQHIWQQDHPGGDWSDWNVFGSGDYSRVHADTPEASITPTVTVAWRCSHADVPRTGSRCCTSGSRTSWATHCGRT